LTISTEPTPLSYDGDDATVAFPVTWKYFAKSHVVATLRSSAGVETLWVLNTDYTLTAADVDAGGTLTATTAPATNTTLVIILEPPNTQETSLPLGGVFPSSDVEDGLDQAAQRDSKIDNLFDRCLRVPVTDTQSGSELQLPIDSDRASMFLAFDANGAPIAAAGTSADLGPVSSFIDTLLDDTTEAIARTTLGAAGLTGNETIAGDKTLSGANTHSGNNTFSGISTFSGTIAGGTPFVLEGATANDFETSIAVTDPTVDRTVTIPNATGTVLLHNATHGSEEFTANGTHTVAAGVGSLWITATAAGGGGGDSNSGSGVGGTGGGSGEWCFRKQILVIPGEAITVTLGANGAASAGSGSGAGGTADDTTFGSYMTLDGGHGGAANGGTPGAGGTGNGHYLGKSGGDASSTAGGAGAAPGAFIPSLSNTGIGSVAGYTGIFGVGGTAPASTAVGGGGVGYGSGGSGGSGGNSAGGAGAAAYLFVEW